MLWAALRWSTPAAPLPPIDTAHALHGLAVWALQFTPRVAVVDEAVVMEVEDSVRLFGGRRALRDRVREQSLELGAGALAWAVTSLGAVALARAGIENGFKRSLPDLLDGLPLETLSATLPHRTTLAQLGCYTLGHVRKLPRGGVSRRFDAELLTALDQAYGLRPSVHAWVVIPDAFRMRMELMSRVELAPALLFGARRLLVQMCGWLAARHEGTTAFTLKWAHDSMRARDVGDSGAITIRTGQATRDIEHLCQLLAEHLAKVQLEAPVGELELSADVVQPMEAASDSFLPDTVNKGESLSLVLERVAARLGPERVLCPVLVADHRLEWMQRWLPANDPLTRKAVARVKFGAQVPRKASSRPKSRPSASAMPQPTFMLPTPLRLSMRGPRPLYQGPLQLLLGPHRVEGGWWHRVNDDQGERTLNVQRDYWVASNRYAGVVWVFQERIADDEAAWYLHGTFA